MGRALGGLVRRLQGPGTRAFAAACLLTASGVPLLVLSADLVSEGAPEWVRAVLGDLRVWKLLGRSLALAGGVTGGALIVGIPMGVLLGRTNVRGRWAALLVHLFPIFLPPFLLALGWFQLLGTQGPMGSTWTGGLLFGPVGVLVTLIFAFAPAVTVLTMLGLSTLDPSLEEAARTVSHPFRMVTRILLPLARPSIALGALVVFALALSEIGVPMFLGVRTYSAAVFTRIGGIDYAPGEAMALVLPLLAVGMLLVLIDRRLLGRRSFAVFGARSHRLPLLPLRRARGPVTILVWGVSTLSLLPLGMLLIEAGPAGLSQALGWIGPSLGTSLAAGAGAATCVVAVGLFLGHALARGRWEGSAADALALFAFITPSSVLGVGLVATWNRPATRLVYTTLAILIVGLVARYAIFGLRTLEAVFRSSSSHYEEAAASFGSSFLGRMRRILLPMHARGVFVAWLITFVFCLRDLDTVVVFYPPGLEPLPVRIFTLEANGPEHIVAGLAVYHAVVTAAILAAAGVTRLGRRGW